MSKRKPLRMDSITHEDIDPESLLGRAILGKDRETVRKIIAGLAKDRKDRDAMEEWARNDFQSTGGLTVEPQRDSLEVDEDE